MPMPKTKDITINLIPKDPFYETPIGKILKWALSIGRYIVIFTELIVILSFVGRFSLDRQVTDLNQEIFEKQTIIESFGSLEADVREVQTKIEQYQQVSQQANIAEIFPKLSQVTPQDVRLDELVIRSDSVRFSGIARSQNSLNLLISNLQVSSDFFNVTVDKIEAGDSQDPGFEFQIRADTKQIEVVRSNQRQTQDVNILDRTQGL